MSCFKKKKKSLISGILSVGIYQRVKNNCDPYINGINALCVLYSVTQWSPRQTFGALKGSRPGGTDAVLEHGRRLPWRRTRRPLQCSCLENPMDRGAWWATVHGVTKRWTRLNDLLLPGTGKELKLEWEQSQVNSKIPE